MTIYDQISRSDPLNGLDTKTTPSSADRVIIVDAAAGNVAKQAAPGTVPGKSISGVATGERSGFPLVNGIATGCTLSWSNANRRLTITPSAGTFDVWIADTLYQKVAETVDITDTEGLWYIYYNSAGVLTATQTFATSLITGANALVAAVYWDATNKAAILDVFDERHGMQMDGATHLLLHEVVGAEWITGLSLASMSVDQDGSANGHAQFGVAEGQIADEDIRFNISTVAAATGLPILYLSGATPVLRQLAQAGYSMATDVTAGIGASGRLVYNQFTGGAWQLTVVTSGRYALCHVFAIGSNTNTNRMYAIIGQNEYTNQNSARAGANTELESLKQLLQVAEFKPIASVIFQTADAYANAVKARVRSTDTGADYVDWRTSGLSQGSGTSVEDLAIPKTFFAAMRGAVYELTDGASITPDFDLANNFVVTLEGNRTLENPTNQVAGQSGRIEIKQDAVGNRTLGYGGHWKFAGGAAPVLTTTASARDLLVYEVLESGVIAAQLVADVK